MDKRHLSLAAGDFFLFLMRQPANALQRRSTGTLRKEVGQEK